MRQIEAKSGIFGFYDYFLHNSYFDKLLQMKIESLVKRSICFEILGEANLEPKMAFFMYNSGHAQYFLAIFGMITYFGWLLQIAIQSLLKRSLLLRNFW